VFSLVLSILFEFVFLLLASESASRFITIFPVAEIINSKILEIGCNFNIKALLAAVIVVKLSLALQRKRFFEILSIVEKCGMKVRNSSQSSI
jgi:hypothetical protein